MTPNRPIKKTTARKVQPTDNKPRPFWKPASCGLSRDDLRKIVLEVMG